MRRAIRVAEIDRRLSEGESLYFQVGNFLLDKEKLEFVKVEISETGNFSCVSEFRTPKGYGILIEENNQGQDVVYGVPQES